MDLKLSTQEFAEVMAVMNSHKRGDSEKRAATRVEVNGPATVWWLDPAGRPLPASSIHIADISLTGVGFLTGRAVAASEMFIVGLTRQGRTPLVLSCRALRTRELAEGVYRVGAAYLAKLERAAPRVPAAPPVPLGEAPLAA